MYKILLLATLAITIKAHGQPIYSKVKVDTVKLKDIEVTKVVVYQYKTEKFLVDFNDFKTSISTLINSYNEIKHPAINNNSSHRKTVRRSVKKLRLVIDKLNLQSNNSDTVFIPQIILDQRLLLSWDINQFITSQIDNGRCVIIDKNNVKQYSIIREESTWSPSPTGRGGRRYYYLGDKTYFIDVLDWLQ